MPKEDLEDSDFEDENMNSNAQGLSVIKSL